MVAGVGGGEAGGGGCGGVVGGIGGTADRADFYGGILVLVCGLSLECSIV